MTTTDLAVPEHGGSALVMPSIPESVSHVVAQYKDDLLNCAAFAAEIVDTPFVPAALWPAPVLQRGEEFVTLKASGRDGWDFRRRHPRESDEAFTWRRHNAIATTAAIVYSGANLGLNWQAALSGIYVANGRTSLYAAQIRALILSAGHTFDVLERGDEVCRVSVQRRGEAKPTEFSFTMAQAVRAGYVKGKGPNTGSDSWKGNDKYNTDPPAMLFARVTTIAADAKFADVVRGMVAREILNDERSAELLEVRAEVVEPAPRTTAAAILARAEQPAPPAPEPAPVDDGSVTYQHVTGATVTVPPPAPAATPPATPSAPSGDGVERYVLPISKARLDLIATRFAQLNLGGRSNAARDGRLAVTSHIVERKITEPRQLTNDEAKLILDHLAGDAGARLVDQVLNRAQATETPAEPAEQPAAPADDEDPYANLDPTVEAGWAGDEAAGDAQ